MKAYLLTVLVIDFDSLGEDDIVAVLEEQSYPNHCIVPDVVETVAYDIGEWDDDHPMNRLATDKLAWLESNGSVLHTAGMDGLDD